MSILNPQFVPTLFKLGRSTADDEDNKIDGKPVFVECGCCGMCHPKNFFGDCRDDDNRFTQDILEEKYGIDGWELWDELPPAEDEEKS